MPKKVRGPSSFRKTSSAWRNIKVWCGCCFPAADRAGFLIYRPRLAELAAMRALSRRCLNVRATLITASMPTATLLLHGLDSARMLKTLGNPAWTKSNLLVHRTLADNLPLLLMASIKGCLQSTPSQPPAPGIPRSPLPHIVGATPCGANANRLSYRIEHRIGLDCCWCVSCCSADLHANQWCCCRL